MHPQLLHAVYCHRKIKSLTGKQIKNQDSYFLGHVWVDDLWGSLQSASGRPRATCWFGSARGEANLAQRIKGVIIFRVVLTLLLAEWVSRARVNGEWRAAEQRAGACAVCGTLTDWDAGIMWVHRRRPASRSCAPRDAPSPPPPAPRDTLWANRRMDGQRSRCWSNALSRLLRPACLINSYCCDAWTNLLKTKLHPLLKIRRIANLKIGRINFLEEEYWLIAFLKLV